MNAAAAIRERDKTGSIVLVSEEPYSGYNRPMLTKSMMAGLTADQIAMHEEEWYEENSIVQVLGRKVTAIDPKQKRYPWKTAQSFSIRS